MNNEIKELIEDMQRFDNKWRNVDTKLVVATYPINQEQMPILLDYITNLQEKVNQYENPDDLTLFYMWLDEKAKDKMKKLQEENKNLKNEQISKYQTLKELQEEIEELKAQLEMYENGVYFSSENDKLQQKIDKAIEYVKSNEFIGKIRLSSENKESINKLLNILQGNDKE